MGYSIYHNKPRKKNLHGRRIHPGTPAPTFKTRAAALRWYKNIWSENSPAKWKTLKGAKVTIRKTRRYRK